MEVTLAGVSKRFRIVEELAAPREEGQEDQIEGEWFVALKDISLEIETGSCVVLAGANGSGKSLLMNIIAGLEEPGAGTVRRRGKVGIVFQDAESQILGETPREDVAVGLGKKGKKGRRPDKAEKRRLVDAALARTGLLDKAEFPARLLSGGEKRRLAVASVLAMGAALVIFDEPYTALDWQGVREVNRQIRSLLTEENEKKTVIIVSHELEKCLALADRFLVLRRGRLVFDGDPRGALAQGADVWEGWNIHHPLRGAARLEDLLWL